MTDRIACCVPFCRRTRKNDGDGGDWICSIHWRGVPRMTVKQPLFKVVRQYRRKFGDEPFWAFKAGSPDRIEAVDLTREWEEAWEACKASAIERAAGI